MIIDSHCHAGTDDGLTGPWDTRAPLDKYVRRAGRAGIDRKGDRKGDRIIFAQAVSSPWLINRLQQAWELDALGVY